MQRPTIACLSKSPRADHLFRELQAIDPRYVNLGTVNVSRDALLKGALASLSLDKRMVRLDARRSPAASQSLSRSCQDKLDTLEEPPESVIYWGATNWPGKDPLLPFYLVTDGPFDPNDPSYPVEWIPRKWPDGYFAMQRSLFHEARHVFTLSDWARDKILNLHDVPSDRVTKIGWGPIGCIGDPLIDLPKGRRTILSVGHEWERKGMDLVAEAGARIHRDHPEVATVLVGQPEGCQIPDLPGVVQVRHGLPMHVTHQLMRTADVFVMASRFDASPHVLFEALQYGTPVVGSRVCGIPEAIDGSNGAVCEPTVDSIEAALRAVLARPTSSVRRAAHESFLRSGGWAKSAQIVHEVVSH